MRKQWAVYVAGVFLLVGAAAAVGQALEGGEVGEHIRFDYDRHGRRDPFVPLIIPTPTPQPTVTPTPYGSEDNASIQYGEQEEKILQLPELPMTAIVYSTYNSRNSLLVIDDEVFAEGDIVPLDDGTTVRIVRIEPQQVRCEYAGEEYTLEFSLERR